MPARAGVRRACAGPLANLRLDYFSLTSTVSHLMSQPSTGLASMVAAPREVFKRTCGAGTHPLNPSTSTTSTLMSLPVGAV